MPLALEIVPADTVPPDALHRAFTEAFSDYLIGPFNLALAQWPLFLARQAVDLPLSRVAVAAGGTPQAFAFVAPRPGLGRWRLATMGAVAAQRGSGAARQLLDDFLARATQAGLRGVELECFAQNERALRLYRSRGFEAMHCLWGYVREGPCSVSTPGDAVEAVPLEAAFAWLASVERRRGDLPLQVTPAALRPQPLPLLAWRSRQAQWVFAETAPDAITVCSLVDEEPGQAGARALAAELLRRHPGRRITVPQLQRADLGGDALEQLGFARQPLHQLYMRRAL